MLFENNDIANIPAGRKEDRSFWFRALAVYAIAEAVFHIATYLVEYSQCKHCVLPVTFYVCRYVLNLLLIVPLWLILNALYGKTLWKAVLGNVALFLAYYFIYTGFIYTALNSGVDWLVWPVIKGFSFEKVVYGSWFDIGKYVLKLSAIYVLIFYQDYRKAARQRLQLAVMNKDMQLNLLKQQLNPHFYFNTLNNLYGLARSNSPVLVTALSQLENIMQYVVVDCNKPAVLLKQEIRFLESYIELEKLRYEKNTAIEINITGDPGNLHIAPLLLIQLVENAFKHGMKEKSERNWMKVAVEVKGTKLYFKVENSFISSQASPGIGLNSVRNLLMLQYEGRHQIEWQQDAERFSVTLRIDLV